MIRIAKNRCGYTGYTCSGVPVLAPAFKLNRMVCDSDISRIVFEDVYTHQNPDYQYHLIDNYLNLPVSIAGTVSSVDVMPNMGISWSTSKSCVTAVRPFYDLLSQYGSKVTAATTEPTNWYQIAQHLFCMNTSYSPEEGSSGTEHMMLPGMLEAASAYTFPVVTIDTPVDLGLNGITTAIGNLYSWRSAIEDFLTVYKPVVPDVCAIPNLVAALASSTSCPTFDVRLTAGVPIVLGDDAELGTCTYEVHCSCSSITVNDVTYEFDGEATMAATAPFKAGLLLEPTVDPGAEAPPENPKVRLVVASDGGSTEGWYTIAVAVREVTSSTVGQEAIDICAEEGEEEGEGEERQQYKMYAVEQYDCPSNSAVSFTPGKVTEWDMNIESLVGVTAEAISCSDLTITKTSGDAVTRKEGNTAPTCSYHISAGSIKFNGVSLNVPARSFSCHRESKYQYLKITPKYASEKLNGNKAVESYSVAWVESPGDDTLPVGGVRFTETDKYYIYSIDQQNCTFNQDLLMFSGSGAGPVYFNPDVSASKPYMSIGGGRGLAALMTAKNEKAVCQQFRISLRSGKPVAIGDEALDTCTYRVEGGQFKINGTDIPVSSFEFTNEAYVYLNLTYEEEEKPTAELSTSRGEISIGIGGVRLVDTWNMRSKVEEDPDKKIRYRMYVIEQDDCLSDKDVLRFDQAGFLYYDRSKLPPGAPYKTYPYEECSDSEGE